MLIKLLLELIEEIAAIVGAGRGLGVILHAEGVDVQVSNTRDGVVVQVAVGDFELGR